MKDDYPVRPAYGGPCITEEAAKQRWFEDRIRNLEGALREALAHLPSDHDEEVVAAQRWLRLNDILVGR